MPPSAAPQPSLPDPTSPTPATTAWVLLDRAGTVLASSAGTRQLFGWPPEVMTGRAVSDTVLPTFEPEHLAAVADVVAQGQAPALGPPVRLPAQHADGRVAAVELVVWAGQDPDRLTGFLRPVGQPDDAGQQLAALVDTAPEAIVATDLAGTVLSWNPGAERLFARRRSQALGQPLASVLRLDGLADGVGWLLQQAGRGRPVDRQEALGLHADGTSRAVTVTASPLRDATGAVSGMLAVVRDVTEQRRAAAAFARTRQALEAALAHTQAPESTERMLADAAHQLRTPLVGIRTAVEHMLQGACPAEDEGLLLSLMRETARASRLMDALLRMARLDQGEGVDPRPCGLIALLGDEVDRASSLAPALEFVLRVGELPAAELLLDADAVREILGNLLDNARRHAAACVEVEAEAVGEVLVLRVRDDGPGLAPDQAEQAFERFVSLDGRGGSGLGLPIARGLARAHDGDLAWQDKAFVLRLPLVDAAAATGTA